MAKKRSNFNDTELTGPAPQQPGFMKSLGGGVLSGLNILGNVLDVPGSMVRDTAAGKNPFDQLLTPHSDVNRTTGRDLNRKYGSAGRKDSYGNWWGGLGTEILTDPLTYVGGLGVAKSAVGKIMANTGIHGLEASRIATAAGKAGKLAGIGTAATNAGKAAKSFGWVGPREANMLLTPNHVKEFAPDIFKTLESVARNQTGGAFDLASQMDTPMGGLGKFWPAGDAGLFGKAPKTSTKTIQTATGPATATITEGSKIPQHIARGLDVAGDFVRHAKIPGTAIRPVGDLANLVNAKAAKAVTPEDLQSAYHAYHVKEGARYEANLLTAKWHNDLKRLGHGDKESLEVRDWFEFPAKAPPEVQPLVKEVRDYMDRIPGMASEMGVKISDLTPKMRNAGSTADYFMRHITEGIVTNGKDPAGKMFDPATMAEHARMPWTHGSKGGTKAIAKMAQDATLESFMPKTQGGNWPKWKKDAAVHYITNNYGSNFAGEFITGLQGKRLNKMGFPETVAGAKAAIAANPHLSRKLAPKNTYKAAARSLANMSPDVRKSGIYGNHPVVDFAASASSTMDKLSSSKVALERIADSALPVGGAGTVPVTKVLKALDLDFGDKTTKGALKWLIDHGIADPEKAHLPADTAKFLTQMGEGLKGGPESVNAMLKLYDDIGTVVKAAFTNLDPVRFNVRNLASGQVANALSDQFVAKTVTDANQLIRGGAIQGASQNPFLKEMAAHRGIPNLDDARATEMLGEMAFANEMTGSHGVSQMGQSTHGRTLKDLSHAIPGGHPFRWGGVAEKLKGGAGKAGTSWNPFSAWRGVGGAETTKFAPLAAGEDISHWAESMNRIAPMWALIENGVHPREAAERVMKAQIGYQSRFYTPFEQQVMKRMALFYSFSKGMFPFTFQQLLENPGGKLSQTLRTINRAKGEDELVPQHVAETASILVTQIPGMSPLEDGAKRYITGLGMGFEDPAQFVGGPQNLLLEGASRLNPILKAPLEYMTGQSFFQRAPGGGGRSLDDLDPALGRTLANIGNITGIRESKAPVKYPGSTFIEHLLSNSPVSNLLTKARTITDPRKGVVGKGVNLLTGVKATDVSPGAQDRELRNRIGQIEKQMGGRTFTDSFLPKEAQAELSPKELKEYQQMVALRKLLEARSKNRKK